MNKCRKLVRSFPNYKGKARSSTFETLLHIYLKNKMNYEKETLNSEVRWLISDFRHCGTCHKVYRSRCAEILQVQAKWFRTQKSFAWVFCQRTQCWIISSNCSFPWCNDVSARCYISLIYVNFLYLKLHIVQQADHD